MPGDHTQEGERPICVLLGVGAHQIRCWGIWWTTPIWGGSEMTRQRRGDGRTVDALASAAEEGRGHAAKRSGEALAAGDPEESEWGNPPEQVSGTGGCRGVPREVKHLSTARKREDSPSSGERTGRSPNLIGVRASRRCRSGGRTDGR